MSYQIRAATAADVSAIHQLVIALADFEELSHLVVATEADLRNALFGTAPRVECLVVSQADEDALVAFALFFQNYSTFLGRPGLYLEDLFVMPAHRRQGLARALMQQLAQTAQARGCGRFEWSVLDWNQRAITFYEGLGATVLPEWRIVRMTGPALEALASATVSGP